MPILRAGSLAPLPLGAGLMIRAAMLLVFAGGLIQ